MPPIIMFSGTKRENDNAGDVNTCRACLRAYGVPCSPCSDFIDLEAKIVQTEIFLQNLIAQQNQFRTKINKGHDTMTHRLPQELSTQIFELSLPPSWSALTLPEPSEAELYTMLYISAVCRTWRQIAMGTPCLWKTIPISISDKYKRHDITLKYVEEWLQRAGNYPLSLRIYANSKFNYIPQSQWGWGPSWGRDWDNGEEDDTALLSLVSLINRQSYRWQNLQLAVPPNLVGILKGDIHGAPIIERLTIAPSNLRPVRIVEDGSHDITFSLMGSIKPAPSVVYAAGVVRIDIDWHNVTTIELGQVSFNECLVLLRQAVGLIHCALELVVVDDTNLDEESSVVCPSVQFLRIRGSKSHIMDRFWDLLTLPQLCTLDVTHRSSNLPYHQIMDMLDRSSCRLTSLFLKYIHCESGDAQPFELLRRTPHLTKLSLVKGYENWGSGFYHDVNTFCQFLNGQAWPPSAPGNTSVGALQHGVKELVLPNLEFLALNNIPIYDGPKIQWSGVADLFDDPTSHNSLPIAISNSLHRRPLTTLRISFSPDHAQDTPPPFYIDSDSIQRFSDIIESGISLEFLVPDIIRLDDVVDLIACSIEHSRACQCTVVPVDEYGPEDRVNEALASNYS